MQKIQKRLYVHLFMHHLEGQVCIKFGDVGPLFKKKWSTKQLNSCPERGIEIFEHEFHAVVDHFVDKKRDDYTKFNTKLTFQVVYNID